MLCRTTLKSGTIHVLSPPILNIIWYRYFVDRLCGLVVRVPGYRSRGPRFHSRRYQILWEVVGLERGPLSLGWIIEELLEWQWSGSGPEIRSVDRGDPLSWPRDTLHQQKLALTSPTSGGRSVGIVRVRTKSHGVWFGVCSFVYVLLTVTAGIQTSGKELCNASYITFVCRKEKMTQWGKDYGSFPAFTLLAHMILCSQLSLN
jgi:hypothetical protein